MSEHFEKLRCGPRSLLLLAEKIGVEIDPDRVWKIFEKEFGRNPDVPGASSVSLILDIARECGIARQLDLTHDVDRVGRSLVTKDVAGVLLIWERFRSKDGDGSFQPHHHVVLVHQVLVDRRTGSQYIDIESPQAEGKSERFPLPADLLPQMMAAFLILFDRS